MRPAVCRESLPLGLGQGFGTNSAIERDEGVVVTELLRRVIGDDVETGTRVEVRSRFDQSWARGFEVAERTDRGYRIKRLSDGMVLPTEFSDDDIRQEKRRNSQWWF
jgi:hypothetical protein